MAQSPYRINLESGSVGILQDILSLIASETEFEPVAQSLLVAMQELTGADAAYFVLLESPHTRLVANLDIEALPEDDFFASMVDSLASAIHLTSQLPSPLDEHYQGAMVSPIRIKRTNVAVFTLLFADGVQINDENTAVLEALLNGLKIITQHMLSRSRQDRIMRNQNEFVRIVSHDLRSPLTSMQGFGSMLLSEVVGDLNEKQSHFVDKILSGITQMTALVDNIQDAGRYDPETGFYEMQRTPTDLVAIVQRILDSYILPAEKDTLSVNFNPADDLPIVNVDGNMLERSITNLVDNAIKYTPNGGQIDVDILREDDNLIIAVRDNGYGISAEHQRQLFDRHFRIRRQEHKRVKGSGLGLFIVKSVAKQHDGDAWVESEEGVGSQFAIRIPLSGRNLLGANGDVDADETIRIEP